MSGVLSTYKLFFDFICSQSKQLGKALLSLPYIRCNYLSVTMHNCLQGSIKLPVNLLGLEMNRVDTCNLHCMTILPPPT